MHQGTTFYCPFADPITGDLLQETPEVKEGDLVSKGQTLIKLDNQDTKSRIGSIQKVLIEKESKKSDLFWSGRTEGNIWTIIKKTNEKIKDIVPVIVTDAKGVTLFAERINN